MPFKEIRRLGLDEGGDDVIEFFLEWGVGDILLLFVGQHYF